MQGTLETRYRLCFFKIPLTPLMTEPLESADFASL
jgi:hypothetical protein